MLLFVVLAFMSLGTGPGILLFAPMFLGAALYLHQPTAAESAAEAASAAVEAKDWAAPPPPPPRLQESASGAGAGAPAPPSVVGQGEY